MSKLLTQSILDAMQWLEAHGFAHLVDDATRADVEEIKLLKRRDRREPGRRRKVEAEDRLSALLAKLFRRQKAKVRHYLEAIHPERKVLSVDGNIDLTDDEVLAELIAEIMIEVRDGVSLFDENIDLTLDYTVTNTEAAEWARKYGYDLVRNIDKLTVDSLRKAISAFVETPGMTIGQVMDMLPFDEDRALRVAVTEITRTYAQGQQMAGEQLAREFPDVKVKKRWFTNNDDRVCPLCGPLDGKEVGIDENFYEPEDEYQDGNPPYHVNCRCWTNTYTDIEAE